MSCLISISWVAGILYCTENKEVLWGNSILRFVPLGLRIISCLGTVQFSEWRSKDCSGERHHSSPNRSFKYEAQKLQNEAYQAVLSPFCSSGFIGTYQPFTTSSKNAFPTRRSLWVRLMSFDWIAYLPCFCRLCRTSSDCDSFSEGLIIVQFIVACRNYSILCCGNHSILCC